MIVVGNIFILLILTLCDQYLTSVPDDLMLELYSKYVSAVSRANFTISTRRIFKKYREFEIHVTKLKEVNGYKKHNLFVKENLRNGGRESYIYINNPVESKIPKAYLTLEEFKNALTNRVKGQKNEFSSIRTEKVTYPYKIILRVSTQKPIAESIFITKNKENVNKTDDNLITNTDTTNKTINEVNDQDLNKDKATSAVKLSENNDVLENVTVSENNITLYSVTYVTEDFKHEGTKEGQKKVNSQDGIDTTEVITENTNMEEQEETTSTSSSTSSTSPSQSINLVNEAVTDTTTVVENTSQFQTNNSELTNESNIKEEPRRKKTTKYSSVSMEMRRSTLGRPLVFFGSR